jgi:hypothetical protein
MPLFALWQRNVNTLGALHVAIVSEAATKEPVRPC